MCVVVFFSSSLVQHEMIDIIFFCNSILISSPDERNERIRFKKNKQNLKLRLFKRNEERKITNK